MENSEIGQFTAQWYVRINGRLKDCAEVRTVFEPTQIKIVVIEAGERCFPHDETHPYRKVILDKNTPLFEVQDMVVRVFKEEKVYRRKMMGL